MFVCVCVCMYCNIHDLQIMCHLAMLLQDCRRDIKGGNTYLCASRVHACTRHNTTCINICIKVMHIHTYCNGLSNSGKCVLKNAHHCSKSLQMPCA